MELHANLPAALWPADNCGAVLRERSQRFSPGLQLRGLHITTHNRLNTGPNHLELLCMCCIACWCHGKHSEKRWLRTAKWAFWNWCYLKHFTVSSTREHMQIKGTVMVKEDRESLYIRCVVVWVHNTTANYTWQIKGRVPISKHALLAFWKKVLSWLTAVPWEV